MPDQTETIVLDVDESPAVSGAARANRELGKVEEAGKRVSRSATDAVSQQGQVGVRILEKSRAQVDRLVSSIEKRAQLAGKTGAERLAVERDRVVAALAGETAAIDRVTRAYQTMEAAQRQTAQQIRAGMISSLNDLSGLLTDVGTRLSVAITVPLALLGRAALGMASLFEQAQIGFKTLLGDATRARQFFGELADFAARTPFEFKELIPAARRIRALGFEAKEIIPILGIVGDAVAALGGDAQTLDRIVLALGQIRSKGRVQTQELHQLAEAGIPAFEILAKKIGISIPEAMKQVERGAISASVAIPAILQGMVERFNGLLSAQNKTLAGQYSNLKDEINFLLADVGRALAPIAAQLIAFGRDAVQTLRPMVQAFADAPPLIRNTAIAAVVMLAAFGPLAIVVGNLIRFRAVLLSLSGVSALGAIVQGFRDLTLAASGAQIAMSSTATTMLFLGKAVAVAAAAFVAWEIGRWIRDVTGLGNAIDDLWEKMGFVVRRTKEQTRADSDLEFANSKLAAALRKRGIVVEQAGRSAEEYSAALREQARQLGVIAEMGQRASKTQAANADAVKDASRATEILNEARAKEGGELGRIVERFRQYQKELGSTAAARRDLAEAERLTVVAEAGKLQRGASADVLKNIEAERDARRDSDVKRLQSAREFENETLQLRIQASRDAFSAEERIAEQSKDRELRRLEGLANDTVQQKLDIEAKRAEIETQSQLRLFAIRAASLDRELQAELSNIELIARARGESEEAIAARRDALIAASAERGRLLTLQTEEAIAAARETAGIRSAEIVQSAQQRASEAFRSSQLQAYEGMKRNVEGLFDAIVTRSKSFGQALADAIKIPFLAAIKEIVSSRVAAMLMQLFGGARGGQQQPSFGGGGGGLASLGGLLAGGQSFGLPDAPGGTSGFTGPVGSGGGSGAAGFGGILRGSGVSGGGLRDFVGLGSSIKTGAGSATTFGAATFGQKLSALGKSDAALAAGGLLAFDGLRRGGKLGVAETTAGGALIGFRFGGPIGAAIGAAVGFGAGIVRLFIKGAQEKIVEKVKAAYGVTISKDFARDPLLGIIKQQFGGNIDVGIRSKQVRDLIELYAMSTGESTGGFGPRLTPVSLTQTGSGLFQSSGFLNGAGVPSLGGSIPTLPGTPGPVPVAETPIIINMPDPSAYLEQGTFQGIVKGGRVIQQTISKAAKSNVGRIEPLRLAISPNLVTS